jgi:capsule polysaccharide export protein KpsE/RkpR
MADRVGKSTRSQVDTLDSHPEYRNRDELVPQQDQSGLKLRILWDQRRLVFRWLVYGFIFSTLLAFLIPRRFESVTRLMPPDQSNSGMAMLAAAVSSRSGSGLGGGTGLGSIADDLMGIKNSGDLFIGILQSRTVQDDLINKFNLRKVYWDRYMDDARKDLEEKTTVTQDRKSGIITIRVSDRNPQRAMGIAQEYVAQLNRVVILLNTSAAHREREFLEERLTQVKQDLESAENGFSDFASKNTALDIPAQGRAMIAASATLQGQLIAAQTELESLRQIYADNNVRVRTMQARVDELRHQLDKLGGKFDSGSIGNEQNAADAQTMYPSIKKLPLLGVKYADLYRNSRVEEALFETLTQEYELAKVQEVKETPSVKILDSPSLPEKKSYPPRLLIIFLVTMLAAAMSAVWIFCQAYWAEIDENNPHKMLAIEISQAARARFASSLHNGSNNRQTKLGFWSRLVGKRPDAQSRD